MINKIFTVLDKIGLDTQRRALHIQFSNSELNHQVFLQRIDGDHAINNGFSAEQICLSTNPYLSLRQFIGCQVAVELVISCPSYNNDSQGEIKSGKEIQISGIYEPWFDQPMYEKLTPDLTYNPYVGCPNYFLEGSTATPYKLEGIEQDYDVKWYLIWEDNRYLDGNIPAEEQQYILNVDIQL